MSNNVVKNSTDNYEYSKDLLNLIKTKSFYPILDVNSILSTKLQGEELTNVNSREENSRTHSTSLNTIDDKTVTKVNNDSTTKEKIHNQTDYSEFLQNIALVLNKLCTDVYLKEKSKEYVVKGLISFIESFLQQITDQDIVYKKLLFLHLKTILGEEYQSKILLIKRAVNWLGLDNLESSEEYLNFLYKMVELGVFLSEDQSIKNEQHSFILTKEEARRERNALIADDNFTSALTNKMHPLHKDVLNKLRKLNNIIVS